MQLQVSTKYAIRILQYIHLHSRDLLSATTISSAIGVTYPYFLKIAILLRRHGLLDAVQGRHGGYMLAKPATEISVYDIFLAVEGELQLSRCLADEQYCNRVGIGKCSTHDYFLALQNDVATLLSRKCLADFAQ